MYNLFFTCRAHGHDIVRRRNKKVDSYTTKHKTPHGWIDIRISETNLCMLQHFETICLFHSHVACFRIRKNGTFAYILSHCTSWVFWLHQLPQYSVIIVLLWPLNTLAHIPRFLILSPSTVSYNMTYCMHTKCVKDGTPIILYVG